MPWIAFIDGGARGNPGPAGVGVHITDASGQVTVAAGLFLGHATNNQAEYRGLLAALDLLTRAGASDVEIRSDSELLVRQMQGKYKVKAPGLIELYQQARSMSRRFASFGIRHIPREQNNHADDLANKAMDRAGNVVVVDRLGLAKDIVAADASSLFETSNASSRRKPSDGAAGRSESAGESVVEMRVIRGPRQGVCAGRLKQGQTFRFGGTVPSGVCVQGCSAVLEAVLALQAISGEGVHGVQPMTVACPHPGCGAAFELRLLS